MARSELALAVARSTAPVPDPEGLVRVPLTGYVRVAPLLGMYLGMFVAPILFLLPPLSGIDPEIRRTYAPWAMILGAAPGFLIVRAIVAGRATGRAIAFDARHVWIERRGEVADPLPWDGLRLRGGRVPRLVAPDGRTIPFQREAFATGPDARYLVALVDRLPKIDAPSRFPGWLLLFPATFGVGAIAWSAGLRPPLDAEGPYWSPERLRWLGGFLTGLTLLLIAGFGALLRYAVRAEVRERVPSPPKLGDETAAWFRRHRFRPPATALRSGVTYGYRDAALWRAEAKSQRDAKIALLVMGLLILVACLATTATMKDDGRGDRTTLLVLGVLSLAVLGAVAIFAPTRSRDGWTIRVDGERATVTLAGRETSVPWPPAETRDATEFDDWTDEVRDGRRRIRFDRRLLVPIEE